LVVDRIEGFRPLLATDELLPVVPIGLDDVIERADQCAFKLLFPRSWRPVMSASILAFLALA